MANEIANRTHAMIHFIPAATQGAVEVVRTQGIDQLAEGSNKGVVRIGVGRYRAYLTEPLSIDDAIPSGTSGAGVILSSGIDVDGTWLINIDTNAGAPTDAFRALAMLTRFPSQS